MTKPIFGLNLEESAEMAYCYYTIVKVKSSLFHHRLKIKQAGNSDKTMRSSRSTAPISDT